jgi:hypothetical protein
MASGPTVVVRILGNLKNLTDSFKDAQTKGSSAAKGLHDAFSGTLAAINKTGVLGPFGDALAGVDTALDSVTKHAKDIGPAMMGVGGALAGIGVGLSALGSKDQAAHQQLQAAVEATGRSYDDYGKQVDEAIKKQEKFGNTANTTQDALRVLTQATNDPAKALEYLGTASDLAAAKHEDLVTAATALGKAYNGNTKVLKEFGVTLETSKQATTALTTAQKQSQSADDNLARAKKSLADIELVNQGRTKLTIGQQIQLKNAQQAVINATTKAGEAHKKLATAQDVATKSANSGGQAVDILGQKLKGQASAAADTFGGKIAALRAHFDDAAAELGQKYGPAITAAGSVMAGLGGAITATQSVLKIFTTTQEAATVATEGMTGAEIAADAAGLPLLATVGLVVLAVAALVAIAIVLYKNWSTIWGGIKAIAIDVWNWIKANWPLLLGILLGPIALAAALIYKYWNQIWSGIQVVYHWIAANWPLLLAILTGPIGLAIRWIVQNWGSITSTFSSVLGSIERIWSSIYGALTSPISSAIGWISGAAGQIAGFFSSAAGGIANTFVGIAGSITGPIRGAFDGIASIWNSTVGSLSFKIPGWVPGLGGDGFSMPKIPRLAQGGLITGEGIVYVHPGEVISPAPDSVTARRGPALVIQSATFNQGVDVDLLMRRTAWLVKTRGM